ncbi:MAG TPA: 2-oxoacid:acceptor oxidoreductase family protein [Planctomycetota bacterium]|nr:2-oxoacid:acceptor oxidoreductase family protein [Planctomycetota bacterium]
MTAPLNKPRYPGIPTITDGSGAVTWVDTNITQAACAYPITSSTTMGGNYAAAVSNGMLNLWGEKLLFIEPESEHSAAATCEGFALAGGRVTNFTSGQGLVLMKEVLYTISGKRLPIVFHIGARALTSHSLNVHAGHDDVMSCADAGWGIIFGRNPQEASDLALICRRAAEACQGPIMNVQDGFLITHTIENVLLPEKEFMKEFMGKPQDKIINLFDTNKPLMTGVVQDQDSYMKGKIAQRHYYVHMKPALMEAMKILTEATGRKYGLIDAYKMDDAEFAIIGMGCLMETAVPTVDYMRSEMNVKVGALNITSYRPFPGPEVVQALKSVKAFTVVERMDDPLAPSNPLMRDIKAAFVDASLGLEEFASVGVKCEKLPMMLQCSAGLGSRDIRPGHFIGLVQNMRAALEHKPFKEYATVGIKHETAIEMPIDPDVRPEGSFSMRGHSVGGYGSVTTNKVIASLMGDLFGVHVQAYPKYGSSKKGLPTTYYLTVAPEKIHTHCELENVEFIPLNDVNALNLGDTLRGLANKGIIFLNTNKSSAEEVWAAIPKWAQERIRAKQARVMALDTFKIADEVATNAELRIRMMGVVLVGVFLKATPFAERTKTTYEQLMAGVEKAIRSYWGKRGEQVVQDNLTCIRRGYDEVFEIPAEVMAGKKPASSAASGQVAVAGE